MSGGAPRPVGGRRAAVIVFGLFVTIGLVVVFAGALSRSAHIEAEAARLRLEVRALETAVAAVDAEMAFIGGQEFVRQQARREGFGDRDRDERLFELPRNAPSPEPIEPIGGARQAAAGRAPFDAWMELLFGT